MLVDDILATLPQLRTEAEGRMVDACTITRASGDPTFDENTGTYTPASTSSIYTGPCEVKITDSLTVQVEEAGGGVAPVARLTVKVPASVENVRIGDLVTITSSLLDPELVGRVFTVNALHYKTFATSRRFQVEEAA